MRLSTTIRKKNSIVGNVEDCFRRARGYKRKQQQLLDDISSVAWANKDYQSLPKWAQEYIRGWTDAKFNMLNASFLLCYQWRGRIVTYEEWKKALNNSPSIEDYNELATCPRTFVWDTDKREPYGEWRV